MQSEFQNFIERQDSIAQNLSELGGGKHNLFEINERQERMQKKLDKSSSLAAQLKADLEEYSAKKEDIGNEILNLGDWLTQARERLSKSDSSVSNSDGIEDVLSQLESVKVTFYHSIILSLFT